MPKTPRRLIYLTDINGLHALRKDLTILALTEMLSYLAKQGVDATVYVVEQEDGKAFNRAKLLNIGVLETEVDCDYFVTHDVGMIPIDVDHSYAAAPTHLAATASQFNYSLPSSQYFGGITLFSRGS